jgi:hypothetical protein
MFGMAASLAFRERRPALQRKCECGGADADACQCPETPEGGAAPVSRMSAELQRKAGSGAAVRRPPVPPIVSDVLASPGQALGESTRQLMEPRFGTDFSDVRVHTDDRAGRSALAVQAKAYTSGTNVVFAPGAFRQHTRDGQTLIAHELSHVVQQSTNRIQRKAGLEIDWSGEAEADRAANRVVSGQDAGIGGSESRLVLARQHDPGIAPDPAKAKRDQQIAAFLNANPGFVGVTGLITPQGFVEEAGGLKALERDYPSSYPIIRARMVAVVGEDTFADLYRRDTEIMELVRSSDIIVTRVEDLLGRYRADNRDAAADWIEQVLPQYELYYADAAMLYKEQGNAFLFTFKLLLDDPEVQIEQLHQLAEERQSEYSQRVVAGLELVGTTIAELDVFMWFNDEVTLEELMAPQEGVDSYREALVWAALSETACAVLEVKGRFYLYKLNYQYSLDEVLATGFERRSELLTRGSRLGITVVTTDGTTLSAREGRYFVDQTERPVENLAAEQDVLAGHASTLSYSTGFRLFRQMTRDLVLANLARARSDLNRERARFFEMGIPSGFTLRPQAGEELQRDAAEFRRQAALAASLAESVADPPSEAELAALEEALKAIGEIHERNPTAALMVVNLRDKDKSTVEDMLAAIQTGEADSGFRDRIAGMMPGDAATAGALELARRLENVERVENHVLRNPDAVLDMVPLHEQILEHFPDDQRQMIGIQLTLHNIESLAKTLGMAAVDLALTITAFVVGGPVGLAIGGVATAHGVDQAIEAFENVDLLEAMTALDVYGEFALATPEMVSSARTWAWIGAGLTLLDVGGFVREARHMVRLRAVLGNPELSHVLRAARADFGDAARAMGRTERDLARELSLVGGAERSRLVRQLKEALEGRQLTRWEASLSDETRELLRADPALRTRFLKMSPLLRRILTRCGSFCIPPGVTDAQRARIENFLARAQKMTGKGGRRFGDAHEWLLREHFYIRRDTIDDAIGAIERVANLNDLEATLRRAASERAVAMRGQALAGADDAIRALPAEPVGPPYKGTLEHHGAQRPAAESWERATGVRRRGTGGQLLPHGQFYDNRFIEDAFRRATHANQVEVVQGGRTVHEFDIGWPVGRVWMPNQTVISDVTRVRVILEPDGSFVNAFPIPPL